MRTRDPLRSLSVCAFSHLSISSDGDFDLRAEKGVYTADRDNAVSHVGHRPSWGYSNRQPPF